MPTNQGESPQPSSPTPFPENLPLPPISPAEVDPEVYAAWKNHMVEGYKQNSLMFRKVLDAFIRPYWMTVWMYRLMFFIGIGGFLLAAGLSLWKGSAVMATIFAGLTVFSFLAFFVSQPLRSLEQNILFITWLGMIYNTYWTRLMYANQAATIQQDLDQITRTSIDEIVELLNKHGELSGKRPGLPKEG